MSSSSVALNKQTDDKNVFFFLLRSNFGAELGRIVHHVASETSSYPDQRKQDYLISYSLACCRRQFARVKPLKDATIVVGGN